MTYQHTSRNNPPHSQGSYRKTAAQDARLQPDPELALADSPVSTWKTVVAFAAMIFATIVVLYGLNNQRDETGQTAAHTPAANAPTQTLPPAAPQAGAQQSTQGQPPAAKNGQPPAAQNGKPAQPAQSAQPQGQPAQPKSQASPDAQKNPQGRQNNPQSPEKPQGNAPADNQKQ